MGLTKAKIKNVETGEEFSCLFNPTEYTLAKNNQWNAKTTSGKDAPALGFAGGDPQTMTVELFFDVSDSGTADVKDHVNKLWDLSMVNDKTNSPKTTRGRPPRILFLWGNNWSFKAVITSLSVRYTLFREDGTAIRATANVTLQQVDDDKVQKGQNPTSFVPMPGYKTRMVQPLDTLAGIAYSEYGDATMWRKIAEVNKIVDPEALSAGDLLAIPPAF